MEQFQEKAIKESISLIEGLVALIVGGIGTGISMTGITNSDPVVYGLGLVIMAFSAIWIGAKSLDAVWDFIERIKKKK